MKFDEQLFSRWPEGEHAYLAGDDDRLERFLGLTGIEPGSLRAIARDPAGLGAVLDYVLGWEPLLLEFAAAHELPPVAGADAQLARGAQMGWFNMGSTVIVLFPKDRVRWLAGLASGTPVRVGQTLGQLQPVK